VYLGRKNLTKDAQEYAKVAIDMDKKNRDYWLNYGTLRLQAGTLSSALTAYQKARDLDPNWGLAWYSIGVVYDYMLKYDKAVEAYTTALALDPSLGDSKKNPQVVNNDRLLVVNLLLSQGREGGLALPLQGGPPVPKPAPIPKAGTKSH
jgi:tetratricopeptide (TPR) repeat protein